MLGFGCCALLHLYGLPVLETLSGGSREKAGPVFDAAILYLRCAHKSFSARFHHEVH